MLQWSHLTSWVGYVWVLQLHQMAYAASRQLLPKSIVVLLEIAENVCLSLLPNSFQDRSTTYVLLYFVNRNLYWHNICRCNATCFVR